MTNLSALPQPLLLHILQHLDVVSLCRLEQTCQWGRSLLKQPDDLVEGDEFHVGNQEEEDDDDEDEGLSTVSFHSKYLSKLVWKPLFDQQFPLHSPKSAKEVKRNGTCHRYKALYKTRHENEVLTFKVFMLQLGHWPTQKKSDLENLTQHLQSLGCDGIPLCWRVWQGHHKSPPWPSLRMQRGGLGLYPVASQKKRALTILKLLHCLSALEEFHNLVLQRRRQMKFGSEADAVENQNWEPGVYDDYLIRNNVGPQPGDPLVLEKLLTLVGKVCFEMNHNTFHDTTSFWIQQTLDDLANQVHERMLRQSGNSQRTQQEKFDALQYVLFENDGNGSAFVGDTVHYYNYQNSLLHTALQDRKGLPLTLAVIYQAVAYRIGLGVEIVGLPGHVVVKVPSVDTFVDVFSHGRILTERDCANLCLQHGVVMEASHLRPLIPELVIQRVLNNLELAGMPPQLKIFCTCLHSSLVVPASIVLKQTGRELCYPVLRRNPTADQTD